MPIVRALAIALLFAPAAQAQVQPWPSRPGSAMDQHRWRAEQHRYEMDRLRAGADQREALARRLDLETRLTVREIEARRQADPYASAPPAALRTPEEERAARLSASERRRRTTGEVGQIDAWLDRVPQ